MYHKSLFPDIPTFPEQNVHNLLFNRPEQQSWPDYTLYVDALIGQRRSYREFLDRVRDGGTALGAPVEQGGLGLNPGGKEIVAILSENCLDYMTLLHSCFAMTVPFTMFSSYATVSELKYSVSLTKATRLFVSKSLLPLALSTGFPDERIYLFEGHINGRTSFDEMIRQVRNNHIPRQSIRHAERDTLAYLILSSGTSGPPKAVMISHGNILNTLMQAAVIAPEIAKVQPPATWNGPDGRQTIFSVLPLHHAFGLHLTAVRIFLQPTTIVLLSKWDPDVYLDSIPKPVFRITSIFLIPSLVHQLLQHPRLKTTDFSTVQTVMCGAAYLPQQLASEFVKHFPTVERVNEGYGMSEATISVSATPTLGLFGGRAKIVPGSAGMLLPGFEACVVREDGSLADENEPGELYLRSGSVALGYWNDEKATKETFVNGWLRTGDRFRIDKDEVLYFEDRTKDTLKVSGMQVSPVEIENTLLAHPDKLIIDASVAGVSGGRISDEKIPRAWVVLSSAGAILGETQTIEKLDAWVRENLSKYKWLRGGIVIVDKIPKSESGKVLRRILVQAYEEQRKATRSKL
ncbi:hypothetical protein BJ138DRAFT_1109674 [Hygrophoropsis aurantiaca]|uniref:Uncharacterized protein n=1 Tax=Hygrophoropsis aurantiaca TaxID=72124 RepID=A0ACB8ARQ9_9AGAM|nr:hypothetical protein BJ138DRAFT_1109674 [Hygrophoropsis aurantiaca]